MWNSEFHSYTSKRVVWPESMGVHRDLTHDPTAYWFHDSQWDFGWLCPCNIEEMCKKSLFSFFLLNSSDKRFCQTLSVQGDKVEMPHLLMMSKCEPLIILNDEDILYIYSTYIYSHAYFKAFWYLTCPWPAAPNCSDLWPLEMKVSYSALSGESSVLLTI